MAVVHFNEIPLCNQVAKKNPLKTTGNPEEVTCKKCIKKLAELEKEKQEKVVDENAKDAKEELNESVDEKTEEKSEPVKTSKELHEEVEDDLYDMMTQKAS